MTVRVIWFKELLDTLRDRRTLWAMILGPVLIMPIFVLLPQKLIRSQIETQGREAVRLAVRGAENAPGLIAHLQASGEVQVIETNDPAQAVRDEQAAVGLILPPGFEAALQEERTAEVQVLADESELTGGVQSGRIYELLAEYGQSVVEQRLASRGLDPEIVVPFSTESVNVATPREMGGAFLGMMLPMFIVLWALVGGMYTAIDVTAGEKERLTLEPLLTAPVGRAQLVLGKLLAIMTTSLVALALSITSMLVAFALVPLGNGEGEALAMQVDFQTVVLLILAALPVVLMFSALEMAVCILARSFKEAQNYIVPLQFVVLIPAIGVMVLPDLAPPLAGYAIPIFSTLVVLRDLFLGKFDAAAFAVMTGSALVYAALAVLLALRQFGRERVLFRV
jgi:sodium transport system permease protein